MEKKKEAKELYIAPKVELLQLSRPMSLLETFSGTGSVDDVGDGGEWGTEGDGNPTDWFD